MLAKANLAKATKALLLGSNSLKITKITLNANNDTSVKVNGRVQPRLASSISVFVLPETLAVLPFWGLSQTQTITY